MISINNHEAIVANCQRNTGVIRNSEESSGLASNAVVTIYHHEGVVTI
jgi:hypothetical protein